ncbi:unnamed protein product [Torque teno tamarin virus]|uniref:Capsid protein n=1 Tax=Torque teno tamarin virus (isolate So-TTV2) TaxID=766186 RepID=CAPSD_TTVE1|nr:hypothetical protein TTtaV_gp2 [Torque teno tamarin virus]Q9DUC1.1 RecName: Full=Capsid protein [Torque teno tamarin virus (isolate So-TTV2)]BAB19316.1 unnamed protein product [Torque teno tamarin virus]
MAYGRRYWRRRRWRRRGGRWWRRRRPWKTRWRRRRRRWRRRRYGRRARRFRRRHRVGRWRKLFRRVKSRVVRQWDPNVTRRCMINGYDHALFWGQQAQHRILYDNLPWPIKKEGTQEGGSMNMMQLTLQFLYKDNLAGRNRWTRSNWDMDLAKYHETTLLFPRHRNYSYVVFITRGPNDILDEHTYPGLHPEKMLGRRKKIVVWSKDLRPHGKNYIRVRVPPPQVFKNQWYFQRDICQMPILTLGFAAFDPVNVTLAGNMANSSIILWGIPYWSRPMPYNTWYDYWTKCAGPQNIPWSDRQTNIAAGITQKSAQTCLKLKNKHFGLTNTAIVSDYDKDNIDKNTKQIKTIVMSLNRWYPKWPMKWKDAGDINTQTPFPYRYSWREDQGWGNKVRLWTRECRTDIPEETLGIENMPLYVLMNGYIDYVTNHSTHSPLNWVVSVFCPYTDPPMTNVIPVGKDWFIQNVEPGENKYPSDNADNTFAPGEKTKIKNYDSSKDEFTGNVIRAPDVYDSLPAQQALYIASPFSLKWAQTTGSIVFFYQSKWTWGGDFPRQRPIIDPCNRPKWGGLPVTGYDETGLLLQNPEKAEARARGHLGDLRRGDLTKTALKRLMELTSTEEGSPQKKKRRDKEVRTTADLLRPEDVYCWMSPTPETPPKAGKTPESSFAETYDNHTKLAKRVKKEIHNQNRRHRLLLAHLRRERDRLLGHHLLR